MNEEEKKEFHRRLKIMGEIMEQHPNFRYKETMVEYHRRLLAEGVENA